MASLLPRRPAVDTSGIRARIGEKTGGDALKKSLAQSPNTVKVDADEMLPTHNAKPRIGSPTLLDSVSADTSDNEEYKSSQPESLQYVPVQEMVTSSHDQQPQALLPVRSRPHAANADHHHQVLQGLTKQQEAGAAAHNTAVLSASGVLLVVVACIVSLRCLWQQVLGSHAQPTRVA